MAVPIVASSTTAIDEATGTSFSINKPSGVASGDVLLWLVTADDDTSTYTTPTGWTLETKSDAPTLDCQVNLYMRRADGTEGATFTITSSNNRYKLAVMMRVTGVDAAITDFTNQYAEFEDTSTGTGHTSPSITTTLADCLVVSAFNSDNTGVDSWAAAGGETEIADIQNTGFNGQTLAVYTTDKAVAGSVTHSATQSPSGAGCMSITFAVPAGTAAAGGGGMMLLGMG